MEKGTLEVSLYSKSDTVYLQGDNILKNKYYKKSNKQFVDYKIIQLENSVDLNGIEMKSLNDNNKTTSFEFTTEVDLPRIVVLDAGELIKAQEFDFDIYFSGQYRVEKYISKDNKNFVQVSDIEAYDFRYLKIEFNQLINNGKAYPLNVSEINITKRPKTLFLLNSESLDDILIFQDNKCSDDNFLKILSTVSKDSSLENFSVDSNTKKIDLVFSDNKLYNSDFDSDGVENSLDNCPYISNGDQKDGDKDGRGDLCDLNAEVKNFNEKDSDKDGVGDASDNCPNIYNPKQEDINADKRGDLCADDDRDGYIGEKDNCVYVSNRDQKDINANGIGDACEFDKDRDGIFDSIDNCVNMPNQNQSDIDRDDIGDVCDNCEIYNPQQKDKNKNGIGNKCEEKDKYEINNDDDGDTVLNNIDNCKDVKNIDQKDRDGDRVGDVCDNCIGIKNYDQKDIDKNGVGDLCDDADGDGILGYLDNCPNIANADQSDVDNNGVGDVCGDDDRDRVINALDNCEFKYNPKQGDVDKDGIGDECDEYDNRAVESNKTIFKVFIGVVTLVFGGLIFFMVNKMRKQEGIEDEHIEDNNKLT